MRNQNIKGSPAEKFDVVIIGRHILLPFYKRNIQLVNLVERKIILLDKLTNEDLSDVAVNIIVTFHAYPANFNELHSYIQTEELFREVSDKKSYYLENFNFESSIMRWVSDRQLFGNLMNLLDEWSIEYLTGLPFLER